MLTVDSNLNGRRASDAGGTERPHAIVIGGGFAGLSAAVDLAERGWRVSVLEARTRLGGRAYSYTDEATGEVVDNGQHAMMGCYHHTLEFLRRIGAAHKVTRQANLRVDMVHRYAGRGAIAANNLPSPLHIVGGILGYTLLSPAERLLALWGGLRLTTMRRMGDASLQELTVEQVLVRLRQSANARASFWNPVAVATLNESPERAAAAPFAEVLARAFFGSRADSQFVFARVGLSDLYTEDARRFIEARGGTVETKAQVEGLVRVNGHAGGVQLRDGRRLDARAIVCAVAARNTQSLLPDLNVATDFDSAPIVSTHLWYDRPVLSTPFVGMIGTTAQWLFNRGALLDRPSPDGGQQVSAVISAAHDIVDWDNERIIDTVGGDVQSVLPAARGAELRHAVVVREKHATISTTPAAERRRPAPETPLRNVFLAGDWIQTGLPATIESAVLSGSRAAARVAALGEAH